MKFEINNKNQRFLSLFLFKKFIKQNKIRGV